MWRSAMRSKLPVLFVLAMALLGCAKPAFVVDQTRLPASTSTLQERSKFYEENKVDIGILRDQIGTKVADRQRVLEHYADLGFYSPQASKTSVVSHRAASSLVLAAAQAALGAGIYGFTLLNGNTYSYQWVPLVFGAGISVAMDFVGLRLWDQARRNTAGRFNRALSRGLEIKKSGGTYVERLAIPGRSIHE